MRVLVADAHPVVRAGLRAILARECHISALGEAQNCAELRLLVAQKPWDVVTLDLSLPGCHGLDVVKEIKGERPRLPILIIGVHSEEEFARGTRASRGGGRLHQQDGGARGTGARRPVAGPGTTVYEPGRG